MRVTHQHWHVEKFPCTHLPACRPHQWETQPTHTVRRTVTCDLESHAGRGRCRRMFIGRNIYCGCCMCTGHYDRKNLRRTERTIWRAEAAAWRQGADPRPPRRLDRW